MVRFYGGFVASVVPDGPTERAGVHEGHRIAAVNGVDLRVNPADVDDDAIAAAKAARLERTLREATAGDEVTLRVWDGARYRDVRVTSRKASEVYEGRAFFGQRMMPAVPGGRLELTRPGASVYRLAPGTPATPRALTVPRGQVRVMTSPRGEVRALTVPRGAVRVLSPSRARRVILD